MTGAVVVLVTAPDEALAASVARALVEERLVACVNIVPGVRSIYRWEGVVTDEAEVLMILKTHGEQVPALEARVRALHPYAVPEFLVLSIPHGSASYLAWLAGSVT